jgi:folate-binding protein YgfZ
MTVTSVLQTLSPDGVEYAAATESAALIDRSERGKLALSGPDAVAFLDSLVSQDIAAIAPGHGADSALLTHKGRMLAEVRVLRTEDELLLDTERLSLQALFDALSQFRIGYRVELHKRTLEVALLSLVGPLASRPLMQPPAPEEHSHVASDVGGRSVRSVRGRMGVDVLCAAGDRDAVWDGLVAGGAVPIGEATWECLRIEAGIPLYGVELDDTTMPQEAGIHERAVSYSKGCYIGQETVARLYWKGKPNRLLRGLRFSGTLVERAVLRQGEREVGAVASVVASPRFGPIGLALMRREAEPGDILAVGDTSSLATVIELPFTSAASDTH